VAGLALSVVVARAVFGPGRITYHCVVGAVLLYLIIGLTFVALYGFVALAAPEAFTNLRFMVISPSRAISSTSAS
jgi:hypothetical protein